MNLKTLTLIAVALWAPIIADADAEQRRTEPQRQAAKCLSKSQILAKLRRKGYRAGAKQMGRSLSGRYVLRGVTHRSRKVDLSVNSCTGKILSVHAARAAARVAPDAGVIGKVPKVQLKCLTKSAIHQKLKAKGYTYLKLENIHGPYNTAKGNVYRAQSLVKEGPMWCQAKLTVNCYNGKLADYETLQETCIY